MPFIPCPNCHSRNRFPVDRENQRGKCGRCAHPLPTFSLEHTAELNDTNFYDFIARYEDLLSLVDFYSPSCGPCRMLAPIIASLPRKFAGRLAVGIMDTSYSPRTAHHYKIRGVPTLIFFKDKKIVDQIVGTLPENVLLNRIKGLL